MKFSVYLAGKIPKGEEHKDFVDWRKEFRDLMEEKRKAFPKISGIVYLDPHTLKGGVIPIEDFFGRDVHMIAMSNAVLVDARSKIGAGTAQEILIAKYYGKPVVSIVPRDSHYRRKTLAMGIEMEYTNPFIFSTSDVIVEDFGQAAEWLLRHFSGKKKAKIKGIDILDRYQEHYLRNHLKKDPFMKRWKEEMQ
jgi:hypothetical protein